MQRKEEKGTCGGWARRSLSSGTALRESMVICVRDELGVPMVFLKIPKEQSNYRTKETPQPPAPTKRKSIEGD